jgi:ribosomal protein S6--L-glutamate ligase
LAEAAESRGHQALFVNPLRCYLNTSEQVPHVFVEHGQSLDDLDAVIPRFGASITFYGTAILRQFEMIGVYPLNESVAMRRARDKLRQLQLLSRAGIDMPNTAFARTPDNTREVIKLVGGAPLVIKLLEGTQGVGVVLAETNKAAESVIDAFQGLKANILVQEFIREADGSDLRCFVIGERVVATMKRIAGDGEFRANIHRGGSAEIVRPTPKEREVAVRTAKVLGLNVAGVDILRAKRGPLVLEANAVPGLEGIEGATQKDIAGEIIRFIEKNARRGRTRTRGRG